MCDYCERHEKQSNNNQKLHQVDLLVDYEDYMACISEISPITKRKHPDCEGEIFVYVNETTVSIPIKFCPICGRKLGY